MEHAVSAPAIRYHGGKFRLAPWILQYFPDHRIYVEPFGGAAGVLIQKPRAFSEVYNDLDGDLVNFFRVVRDAGLRRQLVEACVLTPYAREEFDQAWLPAADPLERARRLVIRAQMGFGSAGATKGTTGFRIDTKREYETAQHVWAQYPSNLDALGQRLAGVLIENRPAIEIIPAHDTSTTLFYVDPPYVHETRCRVSMGTDRVYRHDMTDADHIALLEALQAVRGMVILSGYPHHIYDDTLTDAGWSRLDKRAQISGNRGSVLRTECIWINPACQHARKAVQLSMNFATPRMQLDRHHGR